MSFGEFIPTPNTKLLLHLNGSSVDSSGNGNNDTDYNITYGKQYGKFNEGALFNGSNSNILLLQSTTLDLHMFSHTVCYTIYLTQQQGVNHGYLCGKGVYTTNVQWFTRINSNYKIVHELAYNSETEYEFFESTATLSLNKWYRIVITRDRTERLVKCYVNGSSFAGVSGKSANVIPDIVESRNSYIGVNPRGDYGFFAGYMDEPIIENRIWTPQEIQKDYTNSLGRF